ncbi:ABC transporter ATP-binding protein [Dehalococcoides mccartyi]|uniref:ABC transporter, ATP-binding protein n=1 Tax=Dehalococcoides mccartyi (strain ATCC BAA-2266 / KCTC 15142 / 195) TaxID=243164 RepID=Q3Z6U9_DEHM1|nr:ABC transporter ATP-binding protein [Dehalococcoides mccartyi]AAW39431.1 ABC transporter, ATP-binding protein [Dehalococcoides mccartyi 195]
MIEVNNLSKTFKGKTVLDNISFSVAPGEIFGFLGPNGAGKTTTMRIILGLLNPSSGQATLNGKNLAKDDAARSKVGVLLEVDGIYDRLSAYENLRYFADIYRIPNREARINELLEFFDLNGRRNDPAGKFSKGMKRKLALAKAIMHKPEVLFLDEPASGLDPEAQKNFRDLILSLSREGNMTIFLNSHDLDEVQRICNKVAIIKGGKLLAWDSLANLGRKNRQPGMELSFGNTADIEQAEKLLTSAKLAIDIHRTQEGLTLTPAEGADTSQIITYLAGHDIKLEEVRKLKRSLEEIYLETMKQETR